MYTHMGLTEAFDSGLGNSYSAHEIMSVMQFLHPLASWF